MSIATPVTLVELRAALREMCQLDTNDPLATDSLLNGIINESLHRFQIANPAGWPWDYIEQQFSVTSGVATKAFDMGASSSSLMKIRHVIVRDTAGIWQYPLERMTRPDQLERWPNDSETGTPRSYALLGLSTFTTSPTLELYLRPVPNADVNILVAAQTCPAELSADADPDPAVDDHMIGEYSDVVLSYASFLVYRSRNDLLDAVRGSKREFDDGVKELRRTARTRIGPGRGMNPVSDDRELQ